MGGTFMTSKTKGMKDVVDDHFDKRVRDFIHTSFPAEVTRVVNSATVDVKPLVATRRPDGSVIPYPELYDVRIQTYGVDGSTFISLPIRVGMKVWVFVSERDTSSLMTLERISTVTSATHDLSDCFCIPQFFTNKNIPEFSTEDIVIGNVNTTINVKSSSIEINTSSISTNANVLAEGNIVSQGSIEASELIVNGQSGIDAEIVVSGVKYTFTKGLLVKQEPV